MIIQKFAWKPIWVWDMTSRYFSYKWIWLCWYWDDGHDSDTVYFRLTDEEPMTHKRYTRLRSNRW